jgi:chromosome segregation ATPase
MTDLSPQALDAIERAPWAFASEDITATIAALRAEVARLTEALAFQKKRRAEEKIKRDSQSAEIKANAVSIKRLTAERDGLQRKVSWIEKEGPDAHTHSVQKDMKIVNQREQINALLAEVARLRDGVTEAVRVEREACAKVAERAPFKRGGMICSCSEGLADWTAAAIRAREGV